MSSVIERERTRLLDRHRDRHAWRLWVSGPSKIGGGLDKQGKIGAGYNNLRRKKKKQHCKVGREEEGSSSNQPELAAF